MNESETNEMKQQIFAQLDDFDEYAFRFPFDCPHLNKIYLLPFFQQPTFYNTTALRTVYQAETALRFCRQVPSRCRKITLGHFHMVKFPTSHSE